MEILKADLATLNDIVSRLTQDLKNTIESEADDFNAETIEKLKDSFSFEQLSDGVKERLSAVLPKVPPGLRSTRKLSTDEERSGDGIVKKEENSVNGDIEGDDDGVGLKREETEAGEGDDDEEWGSPFSDNKSGKSPTPVKTSMRRAASRKSTSSMKSPKLSEQSNSTSRTGDNLFGELATTAYSPSNFREQAMDIWRAVNQHKFAVIFRKPVNLKDAPGYIKVVKEPMDLSLIKARIETGKVTNLDELGVLLDLMCENAMKYNGRGDDYYAYAKAVKAHARATVRAVKNPAAQTSQSPNYTRSSSKRKRAETSEGEEEHEEMQVDVDNPCTTPTRRKRTEAAAAATTTTTTTTQPSRPLERRRRRK